MFSLRWGFQERVEKHCGPSILGARKIGLLEINMDDEDLWLVAPNNVRQTASKSESCTDGQEASKLRLTNVGRRIGGSLSRRDIQV